MGALPDQDDPPRRPAAIHCRPDHRGVLDEVDGCRRFAAGRAAQADNHVGEGSARVAGAGDQPERDRHGAAASRLDPVVPERADRRRQGERAVGGQGQRHGIDIAEGRRSSSSGVGPEPLWKPPFPAELGRLEMDRQSERVVCLIGERLQEGQLRLDRVPYTFCRSRTPTEFL